MSTVVSLNDAARIQSGDRNAFEQLFRSLYGQLVRFACGILHDPDSAEDLVQEVFVKLWDRRESLTISVSIKAYLYTMVRNTAFNRLKALERLEWMGEEESDDRFEAHEQTDQRLEGSEIKQHISKALDALPPKCRLVFEMCRFEEKSYQEVADALGISIKTVENQMGKALSIMRNRLMHLVQIWLFPLLSIFFSNA